MTKRRRRRRRRRRTTTTDAKKEFIIKEIKDTTSQALHYLTKLRWNATVEGFDNTDQWHSDIANFLLSIFKQRCEETKAMVSILRQAGVFADRVDERYPDIAQIVAKKEGQCIVTLKDVLLTWSEAMLHSLAKVQDAFATKPRPAEMESDPTHTHRNLPNVEFWGDGPLQPPQVPILDKGYVHDFFNHDRGLPLSTAAAIATRQADTIAKVHAYLHQDYTLPPGSSSEGKSVQNCQSYSKSSLQTRDHHHEKTKYIQATAGYFRQSAAATLVMY